MFYKKQERKFGRRVVRQMQNAMYEKMIMPY